MENGNWLFLVPLAQISKYILCQQGLSQGCSISPYVRRHFDAMRWNWLYRVLAQRLLDIEEAYISLYKVAYTAALYQDHGKMGAEISALAPGETI